MFPAPLPAAEPEQEHWGVGRERQQRKPQDSPVTVNSEKGEKEHKRDLKEERSEQPSKHIRRRLRYSPDDAALGLAPRRKPTFQPRPVNRGPVAGEQHPKRRRQRA